MKHYHVLPPRKEGRYDLSKRKAKRNPLSSKGAKNHFGLYGSVHPDQRRRENQLLREKSKYFSSDSIDGGGKMKRNIKALRARDLD